MSALQYHRILPQNSKDAYKEFDIVDYVMSFPGRSLVVGSVRLEGELNVTADAQTLNLAANKDKDIRYTAGAGAHCFVENITTRVGGMVLESLGDYARIVNMSTCAMTSESDMCNSSNVCELKVARSSISTNLLQGEVPATDPAIVGAPDLRADPDFSIKPRICLNGGSGMAASSRTGDITVSFALARNYGALFGMDVDATVQYALKNLRLTYQTVPETGEEKPVACRAKLNIKQSIQSSRANINVRVPAKCDSVSCSFGVQSLENTPKYDNQQLHPIPNLYATQFIFNDSTNSLVSYQIRNTAEIIDRAIASFVDADKNQLSTARISNGDGYLLGLNFDEVIDLSKQKFSVELESAVSNVVPLIFYMYFHTLVMLG